MKGGERSWISAAVNLSMTFIGPPHLGQRQRPLESRVDEVKTSQTKASYHSALWRTIPVVFGAAVCPVMVVMSLLLQSLMFFTRISVKVAKAVPAVMHSAEHQHEYNGDGDEDLES